MSILESASNFFRGLREEDMEIVDHSRAKEFIPGFGNVGINEAGILLNSAQLEKWRNAETTQGRTHHEVIKIGKDEYLLPTPNTSND